MNKLLIRTSQLASLTVLTLSIVFAPTALAASYKTTRGSSTTYKSSTRVRGYYKPTTHKYVQPHYRSTKNYTKYDNYSTKGNYNPYTGKKGYKNP